ncbi:hypothetical protein HOY80DRAFT_961744 [Tuber brumale]|nr:hypothetical protein HOY80DRAFT_961744 [Tuber brumale]
MVYHSVFFSLLMLPSLLPLLAPVRGGLQRIGYDRKFGAAMFGFLVTSVLSRPFGYWMTEVLFFGGGGALLWLNGDAFLQG